MSGINPTGAVASALCEWLRAQLGTRVDALNLTRAAVLKSQPGPFVIDAGFKLLLATGREDATTEVTLTTGAAVTAATLATDINTAAPSGLTASADTEGRLVLTATATPTTALPSVVTLLADTGATPGANAALGWDAGGEYVLASPLRAPTFRGVCDGWPSTAPDMSQGFWCIIDDREAVPFMNSSLRRDEWDVRVTLHVTKPELGMATHRTREGITSAIQAVTDVLLTTRGRYLGREVAGDITRVEVLQQTVGGRGVVFSDMPNVLHDVGTLVVGVRCFQRPVS